MNGGIPTLTLGSFAKTAKRYALDSSLSEEVFLNALLEPYVEAGRVKGKGGMEFHLDKSRTSKILSGKVDVPLALKKPLARVGIEEDTADRFDVFLDGYFDKGCFGQFVEDAFVSCSGRAKSEEALRQRLKGMQANPNAFFAACLIACLKTSNLAERSELIWRNGTGSLTVVKGDLLSYGFGRPKKSKNIVVIPVNTAFDTEISWQYEKVLRPLVSAKSIHGQWLQRIFNSGESAESLMRRIHADLLSRGIRPSSKIMRGGIEYSEYPIGTIAMVENDKAVFYLLAVSSFDENNNAQSTAEDIERAICELFRIYDGFGQAQDLFVPLIGTGLSRANLDHASSWGLLLRCAEGNRHRIYGDVTVVVHPSDMDESKFEL